MAMVMDMVMAMDTDMEDMATTTARGLLRLMLLLRPLLLLSPDITVMDTATVMAMDMDMEDTAITTARDLLSPDTMAMDMVMDMVMDMDMDTVTDMVMATTDKMVFNCSRVQC